jgi:4-amino-4-deoxy-L-arabinose transferase-like glycosyltransferase
VRLSNVSGAVCRWLTARPAGLAVVLFAVVSFYTRSWEGDLTGDPVHYGAVAKRIAATGTWLPFYDGPGLLYANKPPLMFWLTAVNFRLFGINNYTAKFWSNAFVVGACLVTYLMGKRLFGGTAGLLAGVILAATPGVVTHGLQLRLDSSVMFFAALAVYAVLRAVEEDRPRWLLVVGLAGGLSILTKHVGGLHVAALTLLVLGLRRPRWLLHPYLFGALALAAVLAVPWHVLMAVRHGREFTGAYFEQEMGSRLVFGAHIFRNVAENVGGVLVWSVPWWALGLFAVVRWRRAGARERQGMVLALLWVAEVILTMSIPPRVYSRYMMALYPAVALLAGFGLATLLPERWRTAAPAAILRLALLVLLVEAVLPVPMHKYRCLGYVQMVPLLDRLAPGDTIATYDPQHPTGPSTDGRQWALRAAAYYYLDRDLANYARPEDVAAAHEQFVIAKGAEVTTLAAAGYEVLMPLDRLYWLLRRPLSPGERREPPPPPSARDEAP